MSSYFFEKYSEVDKVDDIFEAARVKRAVTRQIYIDDLLTGLPLTGNKKDRRIDRLIYDVLRNFDLSVIFSGRSVLSRRAAKDLFIDVKREFDKKSYNDITLSDVAKRWKRLLYFWRKAFSAFMVSLDTELNFNK